MPSTKINWQTNGKRITGESLLPFSMASESWRNFVFHMENFAINGAVNRLDFDIVPASSPPRYEYSFRTTDARRWRQAIEFDNPANPHMTFDTLGDYFRLNEFEPQREVRLALIALVNEFELQTLAFRWS